MQAHVDAEPRPFGCPAGDTSYLERRSLAVEPSMTKLRAAFLLEEVAQQAARMSVGEQPPPPQGPPLQRAQPPDAAAQEARIYVGEQPPPPLGAPLAVAAQAARIAVGVQPPRPAPPPPVWFLTAQCRQGGSSGSSSGQRGADHVATANAASVNGGAADRIDGAADAAKGTSSETKAAPEVGISEPWAPPQ